MKSENYSGSRGAITRRTTLAFLGTGGSALLAGCPSVSVEPTDNETKYKLQAIPIRSSPHEHFRWKPDRPWGDHQNRIVDRLVDGESVTTRGYAITPVYSWGQKRRARPRFVERNGTYYQLFISDTREVTNRRWLFWFDKVSGESIPNDAVVVRGPPEDLSPQDEIAFEEARMKIQHHGDYLDLEDRAPRARGFVYRQYGTAESSLIPDPSFTHLKITVNGETHFFKPITEPVNLTEREHVYSANKVAESKPELEQYIRSEIIDVDIAPNDIQKQEREILTTAIENPLAYTERTPLPEAFKSVLDRLGFGNVNPEGSYSDYAGIYLKYGESYCEMFLTIKHPV